MTNKVFPLIVITSGKFRQIETPSNILDGKLAAKNTKPCIYPVCYSTSYIIVIRLRQFHIN